MTKPEGHKPVLPVPDPRAKVDFTGIQWGSVEWTMLCMLYLRAYESRSPRSILGDDFAARDVARIDYDFERLHRRVRPSTNQYGVALRGSQIDAWITGYLTGHPDAVVLQLGCGLHSRAVRMTAAAGVRWFDVDLPQIITLRSQLYSETGTYRMIRSSVTDPGWFDELPVGGPVLIVAEGLLMYLTPAEVTELLHRLVDRFDTGELLADLSSAWAPRLSTVSMSGIIKWGTDKGDEITQWESRLRLIEEISVMAGYKAIPVRQQRLLYRVAHSIPVTRNFDRLFRFAF